MRHLAILTLLLTLTAAAAAAQDAAQDAAAAPEQAILDLLRSAEDAWNMGHLEGYMAAYHESDDLRFASGDEVTYGWESALQRYEQRYRDRAAMGTLTFEHLDVTLLGDDTAYVFGSWELKRPADRPDGLFTLVLRKFPEGWRIVHDHTSNER